MHEMIDSGIEWIGQIPQNWRLKKIKYILLNRNENNIPIKCKNILSLTAKQGVIPLSEKVGGGNKPKENFASYKLAYPGDIVLNSMNILSGSVGLSKYFGCVSPVYYMLRPINTNDDVRFYNYIFQTKVFQNSLFGLGNGILIKESENGKFNTIRMRIPLDKLGNLFIPIAPFKEQQKISDFLDKKCSQLDFLRADIEKQINVLNEYKKSIITEAVTKGLDPNVEMKDSGVEWIGEIPANWKIVILKYCFELKGRIGWQGLRTSEFLDDPSLPYLITGTDFYNGLINWDSCTHITFERFYQDLNIQIKEDDVLITKDGTIGKIAIAKNCPSHVSLNSGVFIARNNRFYKMNKRYFYYLILSSQFDKWFDLSNKGGSTILHLTQEKFYNFKYSYPPLNEQDIIASYLDNKSREIDSIISSKKVQIETLDNYKKSLIYEYVTGKKEVI